MTEQNNTQEQVQEERVTEEPKAHWRTVKAADTALMKATISQESHAAVLEGRISLDEARALGRTNGPDGLAGSSTKKATSKKVSKKDQPKNECLCGCRSMTSSTWKQGHDMRQMGLAKEYVRGERELSPLLLQYVTQNGKLDKARAKVAEEDAKKAKKQQS